MPSLRTIVSELALELQRHQLSVNPVMEERTLVEKINNKRASELQRRFSRAEAINFSWLSQTGVLDVTETREAVDPTVYPVGCIFGRVTIPEVVNLVNNPVVGDHGVFKVHNGDGENYYFFPQEHVHKMLKNKDAFPGPLRIYYTIGKDIFIYPYKKQVFASLIHYNPLEAYIMVIDAVKSGTLIVADDYTAAGNYTVTSGQIIHDGVTYNTGESFDAVLTTFTGNGVLHFTDKKRLATMDDYYPMDSDLKNAVIRRILTEDYGLSLQVPVDNTNDGKSGASQADAPNRVRATE